MSYIKPKIMMWGESLDLDVDHYQVRWAIPPAIINYDPIINAGVNVGKVVQVSLPLAGMPSVDGQLKIGLTAVDDVGNESDPAEGTFPFDFLPPAPPTNLVIV